MRQATMQERVASAFEADLSVDRLETVVKQLPGALQDVIDDAGPVAAASFMLVMAYCLAERLGIDLDLEIRKRLAN